MGKNGVTALGLVLLVLLGVIAIPLVIESTDSTEVESQQLEVGETGFYNHQLEVTVVDPSKQEVTVVITDTETGERINRTIQSEATETVDFERGTFNVTNTVSTSTSSTLAVRYPSTYGFSEGALTISDRLPLILVSMLFVAIMAFVGVKK